MRQNIPDTQQTIVVGLAISRHEIYLISKLLTETANASVLVLEVANVCSCRVLSAVLLPFIAPHLSSFPSFPSRVMMMMMNMAEAHFGPLSHTILIARASIVQMAQATGTMCSRLPIKRRSTIPMPTPQPGIMYMYTSESVLREAMPFH